MPLQPVIRPHTFGTPVNTPNAGTPEESCLEPPQLSDTLANSSHHRVGGGYDTTRLAAGMEMDRLHQKNHFRAMDDQSFNTTLVNYLDQQHRTDATNAQTTTLMDPRSRGTHFVQGYEQSHHEWHDRHSPQRAAAAAAASHSLLDASTGTANYNNRPSSAMNTTNNNMSKTFNSSAINNRSRANRTAASSSAINRRSASSSGYRNNAPTNVKGLFVAFADSAVEERILNMTREVDTLQVEKETDHYNHRTELARFLSDNNRLKQENDDMKDRCARIDALHSKELKEMLVLKEEYEGRYRAQLEENAAMQKRMSAAEATALKLTEGDGARVFQIQSLQFQLQECQAALRRAEMQATDSAKRAREVFDEKELLRKKAEDMDRERQQLVGLIDTKEKIISGLEKELGGAQEKLSSIAFFRESYGSPGGKKGGASGGTSAGAAGGGQRKQSRLYDKFYGRK